MESVYGGKGDLKELSVFGYVMDENSVAGQQLVDFVLGDSVCRAPENYLLPQLNKSCGRALQGHKCVSNNYQLIAHGLL